MYSRDVLCHGHPCSPHFIFPGHIMRACSFGAVASMLTIGGDLYAHIYPGPVRMLWQGDYGVLASPNF